MIASLNEKIAPDLVLELEQNDVFVFGSNLNGLHAGGASLMALQSFGAEWGKAEGPQGQCYAIPTDIRGEAIDNVSAYMKRHIDKFIDYAKDHQEKIFLVTKVGCGNAGFDVEFMAQFFKDALDMKNVRLPREFVEILEQKNADEKENDGIQKVFNLIILDESGSMEAIKRQAISGLNETFQTIINAHKEHQEQRHFISFVTFNSSYIKTVMNRRPIDSSKKIVWKDFYPHSCTPLFDAMGQSINDLKDHVGEKDVVLVTIITDGCENASRQYSGKDIKNLVGDLRKKGWVFAYIGTNQDVDAVADEIGVRSRMSYEYSDRGTRQMFEMERSSKQQFYERLHREGRQFMMVDDYDYFHPDDPADEDTDKQVDEPEEPQSSSDTETTVEEQEQPKGVWGRLFHKK
jgi:hypothetical protein